MPRKKNKKNQTGKIKFYAVIIIDLLLLGTVIALLRGGPHLNFQLLNPKGPTAAEEKRTILEALGLMLIAVVPVLTAAIVIARRYRADHENPADYQPEWHGDKRLEILWWAFPGIIIILLGALTWRASHDLDPYKPIASKNPPITIEVVALNWKWLFIYPDQDIATVNYVEFPKDTPVNFVLTADAPMNSFWIPQLGTQIYAMAGMTTQLHLMASQEGNYSGQEMEINGTGYADMKFMAKAVSQAEFGDWLQRVHGSNQTGLSAAEYAKLAQPSIANPQAEYPSVDPALFNGIIEKYMGPPSVHVHGE